MAGDLRGYEWSFSLSLFIFHTLSELSELINLSTQLINEVTDLSLSISLSSVQFRLLLSIER